MYPWCTRNILFTHCLKELHGHPLFLPAQVGHLSELLVKTCGPFYTHNTQLLIKKHILCQRILEFVFLCWQITQPQPANPLTHPTRAVCHRRLPLTATVLCPFPILAPSAHQTAVTAEQLTAGSLKRLVSFLQTEASTLIMTIISMLKWRSWTLGHYFVCRRKWLWARLLACWFICPRTKQLAPECPNQ